MASILSQYKVYFCLHEPLLFSWCLLSFSVSRLFLWEILLGTHGSLVHIIYQVCSALLNYQLAIIIKYLIKHVATEPYA